jgi:hypothetical protein
MPTPFAHPFRDVPEKRMGASERPALQKVRFSITILTTTVPAAASSTEITAKIVISRQVIF